MLGVCWLFVRLSELVLWIARLAISNHRPTVYRKNRIVVAYGLHSAHMFELLSFITWIHLSLLCMCECVCRLWNVQVNTFRENITTWYCWQGCCLGYLLSRLATLLRSFYIYRYIYGVSKWMCEYFHSSHSHSDTRWVTCFAISLFATSWIFQ